MKGWFAKPVVSILSDLRKGVFYQEGIPKYKHISGYLNTEFNKYIDEENGGKTFWNIWPIFCLLFITENLFIFSKSVTSVWLIYVQKALCTKIGRKQKLKSCKSGCAIRKNSYLPKWQVDFESYLPKWKSTCQIDVERKIVSKKLRPVLYVCWAYTF